MYILRLTGNPLSRYVCAALFTDAMVITVPSSEDVGLWLAFQTIRNEALSVSFGLVQDNLYVPVETPDAYGVIVNDVGDVAAPAANGLVPSALAVVPVAAVENAIPSNTTNLDTGAVEGRYEVIVPSVLIKTPYGCGSIFVVAVNDISIKNSTLDGLCPAGSVPRVLLTPDAADCIPPRIYVTPLLLNVETL